MTTYEILCCFVSDKWYNYQSLLEHYDTIPDRIEQELPSTAPDSYLGRLVELSLYIRSIWNEVTIDTLDGYAEVLFTLSVPRVLESRPMNSKTLEQVREFLALGLPASWLEPVIKVFMPALWTKYNRGVSLNDVRFFEVMWRVYQCDYPNLRVWFANHPNALKRETGYQEVM